MLRWVMKLRPVRILQETLRQWFADDGSLLAAAVAYYGALSLFPLLLVLIAIIGFVLNLTRSGADARQQVLSAVGEQGSSRLQEQIGAMLDGVQQDAIVNGPLGILTLLIAAIGIFAQFEKAFDQIWNVPQSQSKGIVAAVKSALYDRLRAFVLLLGVGGLILMTFIASLALSTVQQYASQWLPNLGWLWWLVQIGVSIALNTAAFAMLYTLLPKRDVPRAKGILGGFIAAIIWEVGRLVLAAFVITDKYSAYGLVGSFIAVMIWIYYASTVVFLGAELVQVMTVEEETAAGARREKLRG